MTAAQADQLPARKRSLVVAFVITTMGLAILAAAVIVGVKSNRYTANAVKTQATVIEIEMTSRRRAGYPRYQYVVDGVSYTATAGFGANPPSYKIGDSVEIEYVPDRPADSRITSWPERWILTLWLGIVGGILALVGGNLSLASRRSSAMTTESVND